MSIEEKLKRDKKFRRKHKNLPSGVQNISHASAEAYGLLYTIMNKHRPVYSFILYGTDKNKNPVFKWFNHKDETWLSGDIDGETLPKRAIGFVGDTAYKYAQDYKDVTGKLPWGKFHTTNQENLDNWYDAHNQGLLNKAVDINPQVSGMSGVEKVTKHTPEPAPPHSITEGMSFQNRDEFINYRNKIYKKKFNITKIN